MPAGEILAVEDRAKTLRRSRSGGLERGEGRKQERAKREGKCGVHVDANDVPKRGGSFLGPADSQGKNGNNFLISSREGWRPYSQISNASA